MAQNSKDNYAHSEKFRNVALAFDLQVRAINHGLNKSDIQMILAKTKKTKR